VRLVSLVALVGVAACGESTGPHGGLLYPLYQVNGRTVPAVFDTVPLLEQLAGTIRFTVLNGTLELVGDSITFFSGLGQSGRGPRQSDTTAWISLSIRRDYSDSSTVRTAEWRGAYAFEHDSTFFCWSTERSVTILCEAYPFDLAFIAIHRIPIEVGVVGIDELLFRRE
jgi:hypothetical protein